MFKDKTRTKPEHRLLTLAWIFFYISSVTLGGGMAMLPVMQREFVEKRGWLTDDEMVDVVAVVQSLPGMIAVNMAVLLGYRICGFSGAVVSAFASVVVPFVAIVFLATGRSLLADSPTLDHIFLGVRAGVSALILLSAVKLSKSVLKSPLAWLLGAASFIACVIFEIDMTLVIMAGLAVGLALLAANAFLRGVKQ